LRAAAGDETISIPSDRWPRLTNAAKYDYVFRPGHKTSSRRRAMDSGDDGSSIGGVEVLPVARLGALVRDLRWPRPWIYWLDLLGCVLAADIGLFLASPFPDGFARPAGCLGFALAVVSLYRASYFNHELAHQTRHLPGFAFAWNLLVGIPLLIPSFLYSDHRTHHSTQHFGSEADVEYLAPDLRGPRGALALVALAFVLPFVYAARFAIFAPAAWLSPAVRQWADTRVSSLGLLGLSRRAAPSAAERVVWRIQEAACFGYLLCVGTGIALGLVPIRLVALMYGVTVAILLLHGLRIMVGHRYGSDGDRADLTEQVRDSYNFSGPRWIMVVLTPLGFHLHALHHLFPNIPYHNMPEAHRRILAALPQGSVYHAVSSRSFVAELIGFLRGPRRLLQ
jgi:fatty acid desaturase